MNSPVLANMSQKWLVIGVSGVTCGGKTTLATKLNNLIPHSIVVSQDDYFLRVDDPRHTWIPELNHINFDIVSSLDMEKMHGDLLKLLTSSSRCSVSSVFPAKRPQNLIQFTDTMKSLQQLHAKIEENNVRVVIIEGFCIFNYKPVADLCCLKYYFTLAQDECYKRRIQRIYDPPDCPGYFEQCVWPEYQNLLDDVQANVKDVKYFDGALTSPLDEVLADICQIL